MYKVRDSTNCYKNVLKHLNNFTCKRSILRVFQVASKVLAYMQQRFQLHSSGQLNTQGEGTEGNLPWTYDGKG